MFESYNSIQPRNGNQVFPHSKKIHNTNQSVKKQGELAELLSISPDRGGSFLNSEGRAKGGQKGVRNAIRLSQVNIESEMPNII
jgi:hypothetical protein